MDRDNKGQLSFSKEKDSMTPTTASTDQNNLNVELVGIKNLKMSHTWRLEFDVYEIDSHKVKDLLELIDMPLKITLEPHE